MQTCRPLFVLAAASLTACATATPVHTTRPGFEVYTFTHDSVNAHLLVKDGHALLFDTGLEKNEAVLEAELRAVGVAPEKLSAIVLSHGHADHAGGAKLLHERFGVPVVLGGGDEPMFAAGKNEALCPVGLMARMRASGDQAETYAGSHPDVVVNDTLDLKALTGIDATLTRVASHTQGSLVLSVGDAIFVGDLFRGAIVGGGAETHFYLCDLEENRRTIKRVLNEVAPQATVAFAGHLGPVTTESAREHFELGSATSSKP